MSELKDWFKDLSKFLNTFFAGMVFGVLVIGPEMWQAFVFLGLCLIVFTVRRMEKYE